jgi:hypothetical protein
MKRMWLEKLVAILLSAILTIFTYTLYYPQITPIEPATFFMSLMISVIIIDLTYPYIKKLWKQRD